MHERVEVRLRKSIPGRPSSRNGILPHEVTKAPRLVAAVLCGLGEGEVWTDSVHGGKYTLTA